MSEAKRVVDQLFKAHEEGLSKEVTYELLVDYLEKHPTAVEEVKRSTDDILYSKICSETVVTLDRLFQLPTQTDDYLIDGLLYKRQASVIMAKDKVGKTIIAMQMACSLTTGKPFLDTYDVSKECNVLYAIAEMSREQVKKRLQSMSSKVEVNPERFFFHYGVGMALHNETGYEYLCNLIDNCDKPIDVLFIDPIYKSMTGGDVCSNVDVTMLTNTLDRIKEKYNLTIVMVHHKRKGSKDNRGRDIDGGDDEIMGSSVLKNWFDCTFNMRELKSGIRTLSCDTQREGNIERKIELMLDENPLHFYINGQRDSTISINDSVLSVIKCSSEPLSNKDLRGKMEKSKQHIGRAIKELKDSGLIKEIKKVGVTPYYGVK